MHEVQWIPIGRGREKADLEKVVRTLEERWRRRYEYRIERAEDEHPEPYRLFVKHK